MYKKFYHHIKNLALIIGYLNLLRSFYDNNKNSDDYTVANNAMLQFKDFCKTIILEIEKLISSQQSTISVEKEHLKSIKNMINSISKPASSGMLQEILESLEKVPEFTNFLTNEFPSATLDQVDLRDIKTEIMLFKYQVYAL